ncbi:hypothetical protein C8A01DRAFT_32027 [Parachaetomium inaequale]|uniref:Uncharacterized protein n=1 Tax=Parachaetomium inaequale TaxID=2588326 RepID=A0AAN6SVT6_9PEZI|nr:hypothetical protein C8A01DRAFT_32027 [Parachaetomium inaequale]
MRFTKITVALVTISSAVAQRPANISICDDYTTALFKNNTAYSQATFLTALVNTVVIGNCEHPNVGVVVPGTLAKGTFNGTQDNLLPFFDGILNSTNRGGSSGVSVNCLDGGGAEPLKMNKPANDEKSNQDSLLIHLYPFFGSLLSCSMQGMPGFGAYAGDPSMFQVHKFMNEAPARATSRPSAWRSVKFLACAVHPPSRSSRARAPSCRPSVWSCRRTPFVNEYEAPMDSGSSTATNMMGPTQTGAAPTSTVSTAGVGRAGLGVA